MIIKGVSLALEIAILVVAALSLIVAIWGIILQLSIFFQYRGNNKVHVGGKTAKQVAEEMLAKLGYGDIQVVRASYFWFFFFGNWGNRYSPRRKKILLYGNILNSDTVTAVSLAAQKVGLVIQHKKEEPKMLFRAKWEIWTRMAPNLFLPIVIIGIIIDLLVNGAALDGNSFGIITLVFAIIALVYTLIAFYALFLVIPTERRAGELALEMIRANNLLPEEFMPRVEAMFKTYVKKYIADFIQAILELIWDILYIVTKFSSRN